MKNKQIKSQINGVKPEDLEPIVKTKRLVEFLSIVPRQYNHNSILFTLSVKSDGVIKIMTEITHDYNLYNEVVEFKLNSFQPINGAIHANPLLKAIELVYDENLL
jgi:hypothetical protein